MRPSEAAMVVQAMAKGDRIRVKIRARRSGFFTAGFAAAGFAAGAGGTVGAGDGAPGLIGGLLSGISFPLGQGPTTCTRCRKRVGHRIVLVALAGLSTCRNAGTDVP